MIENDATAHQPSPHSGDSPDDLEALAAADPAEAPAIADRIAALLAERLEAGGREQGMAD